MPQQKMDARDVIIVGAGWCGLIAAKTYLQVKPDANLLIVDGAATLGGTWCKERLYPHLVAEAHHGLFEFSDLEMPNDGQTVYENGQISGKAVHRYLDRYAAEFGLHSHLRLNTKVEGVSRHGQHWLVTLQGSDQILACEKLIIATGLTSEPFVPDIANYGFKGDVLHSKELGKAETGKKLARREVQTVAVYGGSKSAFDAVYMLLGAGKTVEWIVRPGKGGVSVMTPLNILGRPSFHLNNSRFLAMFSPNLFSIDAVTRWLHGTGPAWLTQPVVRAFWRLITFLLLREARYDESANAKALKPFMGLDSLLWSPATLGVMTHPSLWDDIHQGTRVRVRQNAIQSLGPEGVRLDDETHVEADMVVFSTGWRSLATNFLFSDRDCLAAGLPSPASFDSQVHQKWEILRRQGNAQVKQMLPLLCHSPFWDEDRPRIEDDFHLYKSIMPASAAEDDRSLAYVGFLRTTGAPIVYEAQALWAVAYLQGKLQVPSREKRERETAALNAWVRRRYICGRKVPFAMFDFLPYVDSLYRDLGVNPRRKGNPFSEIFGLYKPSDFKGVVNEWMESREQQRARGQQGSERWFYAAVVVGMAVVGMASLMLSWEVVM